MTTRQLVAGVVIAGLLLLLLYPGLTPAPAATPVPASPEVEAALLRARLGWTVVVLASVGLTVFWMVVGWRAMRAHEALAAAATRLAGGGGPAAPPSGSTRGPDGPAGG